MKDLQEQYKAWREEGIELVKGTDISFIYDCGESSARDDFSAYIGREITFEEMLPLEQEYEEEERQKEIDKLWE